MNLKDQVLKELENRKGGFVSGNELAEKFYVSRNAVWKAVRSLLSEGHEIKAVTKKGYCLSQESDVLTSAAMRSSSARCPTRLILRSIKRLPRRILY